MSKHYAERETDTHVFFFGSIFSQWTESYFEEDGIRYCCTEQYMMAKKAVEFGDMAAYHEIMATESPREHKAIGRRVQNYNDEQWSKVRFGIVVRANYLKFSQNEDLLAGLMSTGNKTIVEASPYDRIWGIGLATNNDRVLFEDKWLGQNLLGKAIMEVREKLRNK